jgi:hypothetical protein
MSLVRTRTRSRGKGKEESPAPGHSSESLATPAHSPQMPAYAQGRGAIVGVPLLDGGPATAPIEDERSGPAQELAKGPEQETQMPAEENLEDGQEEVSTQSAAPVADVTGEGETTHATAYSLTLQGRTDANYRSSFSTRNVVTSPGAGCDGCSGGDCVHVRGTLVSTYSVTTTVTLPSVNDFPDLRPCQRQRVRDGISNVLAPHEQQHVSAFRTYNGTTRQPFDMTICRGAFDAAMQSLHDAEQSARQAAAQALSDALDPFTFDVDLDCQDPPPARAPAPGRRRDAGASSESTVPAEEVVET